MADPFIGTDVRGLDELQAKLKKLPDAVADDGVDESSGYLINVLRHYPPQRYVSRRAAYGKPFFSDRQRRYFFWALGQGLINVPYRRTQRLARGWKQIGKGKDSIIVNETNYAYLVQQKSTQARLLGKAGWDKHTIEYIIKDRIERIVQKFDAGVKKAIRRLGL